MRENSHECRFTPGLKKSITSSLRAIPDLADLVFREMLNLDWTSIEKDGLYCSLEYDGLADDQDGNAGVVRKSHGSVKILASGQSYIYIEVYIYGDI